MEDPRDPVLCFLAGYFILPHVYSKDGKGKQKLNLPIQGLFRKTWIRRNACLVSGNGWTNRGTQAVIQQTLQTLYPWKLLGWIYWPWHQVHRVKNFSALSAGGFVRSSPLTRFGNRSKTMQDAGRFILWFSGYFLKARIYAYTKLGQQWWLQRGISNLSPGSGFWSSNLRLDMPRWPPFCWGFFSEGSNKNHWFPSFTWLTI